MRRWSALPRPFLATLAGVFALGAILYGSLWMYAVRYPGPLVELGFNQLHNPNYDARTHSLLVDDVIEEIGRASCRERGYMAELDKSCKKTTEYAITNCNHDSKSTI